ncbi:MAG: PilN domain-containing protein [Armatimonadota bacterium]|nr:PilN domain-containing protein [bacterium]
MKPFNLAEVRIAERRYCRQSVDLHLRVIVMLILVTLLLGVVSYACKDYVRNRATAVKTQLAVVQGKTVTIKRDVAQVNIRLAQRGWQKQLSAGSGRWMNIMDSVFSHVPDDVWLSKVESSVKDQSVTVDGHAGSFGDVSTFIDGLKAGSTFKEVRLTGSRVTNSHEKMLIEFSLDLKLTSDTTKTAGSTATVPETPKT